MAGAFDKNRNWLRAAVFRTTFFFVFWLILYGMKSPDFVIGVSAAIAATWASLLLLSPGQWHLDPVALSKLILHFAIQSADELVAAVGGLRTVRPIVDRSWIRRQLIRPCWRARPMPGRDDLFPRNGPITTAARCRHQQAAHSIFHIFN